MSDRPTARRAWLGAIDWVAIVVFAAIGRASHSESLDAVGIASTALPFLAANVVGGVLLRSWRHPERLWPTGVVLWLVTVAAGMAIRYATGAGVAVAFVIVATITLGVLLVGWRAGVMVASKLRTRTS